jgi:hypothetical protein
MSVMALFALFKRTSHFSWMKVTCSLSLLLRQLRHFSITIYGGKVVLGIQFSSCHYIPAISFVGTTPNFDKIHITADLVDHVTHSQYPAQLTKVQVYVVAIAALS